MISSLIVSWKENITKIRNLLKRKETDGPALFLIIVYKMLKYVHDESQWLRCSMAEAEQCSMAGGSPLLTYVNLCVLERQ